MTTSFAQTNFYSNGSNNINLLTSWTANSDGSGGNPTNFTTANQIFNVQNGHLMTASGAWVVSGTGSKVIIKTGGQITSGLFNHTLTLDMETGGNWIHTNTTYSNLVFGSLNSGSTFQMNSTSGFSATKVYPNLTLNFSGSINPGTSSLTVNGNLTMKSGAEFRGTSTGTPTHTIGGDIIIESGGSWTMTNGSGSPTYNIAGTITNSGTINALTANGTSTVNLTGSNSKNLTSGTFGSSQYDFNLTVASGKTVTLSDALTVGGVLTINGSLETNNKSLTLGGTGVIGPLGVLNPGSSSNFADKAVTVQSTSAGTGSIGNASTAISGASNVTIQRYIPANANRAWRLLSVPVSGTQTIGASWQASTWITNTAGGSGFDAQTPGNSMLYFDGSALQGVTATTNRLDDKESYFLFVRGDRSSTNSNATVTATTLSATGTLAQGSITRGFAGTGANFSLIPNPYPCAIDFEQFRTANGSISTYYVWDATLGTVGGYRTVTRADGPVYTEAPGGTDATARYISSGQAFWIDGKTTASFTESMKATGATTNTVFRTANNDESISINLLVKQSPTAYHMYDGIRVDFNSAFSTALNTEDAKKMNNFTENLAIARSGADLAIERRPSITANDTIFLKLWNTGLKEYRFTFQPNNFAAGLNAFLEDQFLNTSSPISLTGETNYDFTVTNVAASQSQDRFRIVFRSSSVLPLSFTTIKGAGKGNAIEVSWTVSNESDVQQYIVEESFDGRSFSQLATVRAKGQDNASYTWLDNNTVKGFNYYRVKSIGFNGEARYTSIVNVKMGMDDQLLSVYPNPLKGNVVNLQLSDLAAGSYTVNVYDNAGRVIASRLLQHQGGSATEQVLIPATASKGVYRLELKGANQRLTQNIILQ